MIRLVLFCCLFYGVETTIFSQTQGFLAGRTAGPLPYLEYGLGDDRLGGAKLTYLDTNILVKVIDSTADDYKVQLSKNHIAWLPKVNFTTDSLLVVQPYYLTGSWKVAGDDTADYVIISLDDRLPYKSVQEINPSKIIIDVFGVTNNTNWITQLSTAKEIKNAYYEQAEDDVFRVIIELKHPQHWGYSIRYDNKKLVIKINRQPAVLNLSKLKIAVDAGHGGENTGANGVASRIAEKDYTLRIAKELEKALKKEKANVFMTRKKDTTLSMIERTAMLRAERPDLLISIHLNSSGNDTVKGVSTYYRYIGFRPLTQTILKRMLELGLAEFGNVGSFNFSLSGPTEYPNCLVEVAFLSNRQDEKRIRDPKFHKLVATKIVAGIKDWLVKIQG
jgi:N-acetylmuramoyl-L-alanine amidase